MKPSAYATMHHDNTVVLAGPDFEAASSYRRFGVLFSLLGIAVTGTGEAIAHLAKGTHGLAAGGLVLVAAGAGCLYGSTKSAKNGTALIIGREKELIKKLLRLASF